MMQSSTHDPEQPSDETISVTAPSDLNPGYQFNVDQGAKSFRVEVPRPVNKGEVFSAKIISEFKAGDHRIPHGEWRDGLCDWHKHTSTQNMCCMAFWCPTIVLGQVLTRLGLTFYVTPNGHETKAGDTTIICYSPTFIIMAGIAAVFAFFWFIFSILVWATRYGPGAMTFRSMVFMLFLSFVVAVTMRLRSYMRSKYSIPEQSCKGFEDCCISCWCAPCFICQAARHTADYERYAATCFTETGLEENAPSIV